VHKKQKPKTASDRNLVLNFDIETKENALEVGMQIRRPTTVLEVIFQHHQIIHRSKINIQVTLRRNNLQNQGLLYVNGGIGAAPRHSSLTSTWVSPTDLAARKGFIPSNSQFRLGLAPAESKYMAICSYFARIAATSGIDRNF